MTSAAPDEDVGPSSKERVVDQDSEGVYLGMTLEEFGVRLPTRQVRADGPGSDGS